MYKFLFHTSWRNFTKQGVFPIINIVGLSIGLAVVLLITLMVYNERSFDKSFAESKNIYRINSYLVAFMPGETFASTSNKTGPYLQEQLPEIQTVVRTFETSYQIRVNDHPLRFRIMWADEDFFRLFETEFISGSPEEVMKQPGAIAISETMAKKLFGKEDAMGKTFQLDDDFPVEVKAVYKDYPKNSSFYDYQTIAPFQHSHPQWFSKEIHWGNIDFETYCLITKGTDIAALGQRMEEAAKEGMGEGGFYIPKLQNLEDIHLHSAKFRGSHASFQSDISKVKTLSLLAVIILLIACVNYMNLSTARAQKRSKEIGINKTLGAKRFGLIIKLTLETGIVTTISFVLAFGLAYLLLPVFNSILGEQLTFGLAFTPVCLLGALLIWMVTTVVAASYPALYMSGFPPLLAIRSASVNKGSGHAVVRKVLTVGQFTVAVVLISWVFIIQAQIRYVNNKNIGYNPHNLVGFYVPSNQSKSMADELRSLSSVELVGRESTFLFQGNGMILVKDSEDKTGLSLWSLKGDDEFLNTMQLKLIAGKNLPMRAEGDTITQVILNRKAVEYLETTPEEIIGKKVLAEIGEGKTIVCGVVENFNFEPLYKPVTGFCIHNGKNRPLNHIMVRVKESQMNDQLAEIEAIYKKYAPNDLFVADFPDMKWEKAHDAERRTNVVVSCFSLLAIFVACMGVFGLTAFMAEQRVKEIGIRKVMGASVGNVVSLFTNIYVRLLLISLVIAIPIAWWVGDRYLQDFAYRISLGWWMFAVAAVITIVLTLLTVSIQAIKAATANPVKSLKTE